jgi:multidrug efflux pump subunit AcrA (membrane-fusion protein)
MWKWIVVALAVLGAIGAASLTIKSAKVETIPPLRREPVRKPFQHAIVGAGIVEPESENVVIGVTEPGQVIKVFVAKGQVVKANDPLFQLDTRTLEAEKSSAEAALHSAQADLQRVQAYRRPEDEPGLRAKVEESTAALEQTRSDLLQAESSLIEAEWDKKDHDAQMKRLEASVQANATPITDLERQQFAVKMADARVDVAKARISSIKSQQQQAQARVKSSQADLQTFMAGPWKPDVEKAQATVEESKAKVASLVTEITRRTIRAPVSGTVLRCNLHEGEYAMAGTALPENAPIVLGDLSRLRVRVDVDEFDAPRFRAGAAAQAFFKGQSGKILKLEFVGVEPFVVPKRALTNSQSELVDARVLQVIYRVSSPDVPLYVGQQLDVFIEESGSDSHESEK